MARAMTSTGKGSCPAFPGAETGSLGCRGRKKGQRVVKRNDRGEDMAQGPDWEKGRRVRECWRSELGPQSRLGQEGAAEGEPHLFLGLLGFLHPLHLHLLLSDSLLFLGDEVVNIHTTLEI